MTEALTILKADLRDTLATVGGLRAEERLELNDQLTELLSSLKVLKAQEALEKGQLDAFKLQLSSFRKDVARYDDHQQAYYYPSPESNRNSARR